MNEPGDVSEFSDRHDLVKTICVWRQGAGYRIEVLQRAGKPDEPCFVAVVWIEEEHGGKRMLVRDVRFPWVHHETADAAIGQALESLAVRVTYSSVGDREG